MNTADYCVLYSLDKEMVSGEVEFYFTTESKRQARIVILDQDMHEVQEVKRAEFSVGGNIVRFDSTSVPNGKYFYALITDNQKTTKKMTVLNG